MICSLAAKIDLGPDFLSHCGRRVAGLSRNARVAGRFGHALCEICHGGIAWGPPGSIKDAMRQICQSGNRRCQAIRPDLEPDIREILLTPHERALLRLVVQGHDPGSGGGGAGRSRLPEARGRRWTGCKTRCGASPDGARWWCDADHLEGWVDLG